MHGVALLLMTAAAAHLLARRLRVPSIPLLLLAGVAAARLAPPPAQLVEDALVLGVSFLLFLAGLELDPRRMRAQTRATLQVGTIHFGLLVTGSFLAAVALGFGARGSAYLAVALAPSSTLMGVRLLQTRRQMFEPFGRLVLGVLLVQDLFVLAAIPLLATVGQGWASGVTGLAGLAALGGLVVLARAWLAPARAVRRSGARAARPPRTALRLPGSGLLADAAHGGGILSRRRRARALPRQRGGPDRARTGRRLLQRALLHRAGSSRAAAHGGAAARDLAARRPRHRGDRTAGGRARRARRVLRQAGDRGRAAPLPDERDLAGDRAGGRAAGRHRPGCLHGHHPGHRDHHAAHPATCHRSGRLVADEGAPGSPAGGERRRVRTRASAGRRGHRDGSCSRTW